MEKLEKYPHPSNGRELPHAIERVVIISKGRLPQPTDFWLFLADTREDGLMFDNYHLAEVEQPVIRRAIIKHGGNINHAAKQLGMARTSLYRRLETYGL